MSAKLGKDQGHGPLMGSGLTCTWRSPRALFYPGSWVSPSASSSVLPLDLPDAPVEMLALQSRASLPSGLSGAFS